MNAKKALSKIQRHMKEQAALPPCRRVAWKVWLAKHCEKCGNEFTQKALDGGRCQECRATIPVVEADNIAELIKVAKKNNVGPGLPPRE